MEKELAYQRLKQTRVAKDLKNCKGNLIRKKLRSKKKENVGKEDERENVINLNYLGRLNRFPMFILLRSHATT